MTDERSLNPEDNMLSDDELELICGGYKRQYSMETDCSECARKMQQCVQSVPGVKSAQVNFMAQTIIIEYADEADKKAVNLLIKIALKGAGNDMKIYFK